MSKFKLTLQAVVKSVREALEHQGVAYDSNSNDFAITSIKNRAPTGLVITLETGQVFVIRVTKE